MSVTPCRCSQSSISARVNLRLASLRPKSRPAAWMLEYVSMKKIGFLSFGHWTSSPQSQTRSASDALLQSIGLAVAAEENPPGLLRVEPYSEGLRERIWWGAATNATAEWAAKLGMKLQSSTLKFDESGKPFHIQQAEQIRAYRAAWAQAGHQRTPRISVSRSIFALGDAAD